MRVPQRPERAIFEKQRVARLKERRTRVAGMAEAVDRAIQKLAAVSRGRQPKDLVLRRRFVHLDEPLSGEASDRALPARQHRPPATRIMSPNGIALRFYLLALYEGQIHAPAGKSPSNQIPLIAASDRVGWTDLIAVPFQEPRSAHRISLPRGPHNRRTAPVVSSRTDKKKRRIISALRTLSSDSVQLVYLPSFYNVTKKYEGFQLLDEGGCRTHADPSPYVVPQRNAEQVFRLPPGLFTKGWIHLLEDSELTFLMMLADWTESVEGGVDQVAIPGLRRLLHYGVGWDAYESNMVLQRLGLVEVEEQERHDDGKIVDFTGETELHALRLVPTGFDEPAVAMIMQAFG